MSNQTKKIVLASITLIVAAGLLALNPSNMIGNAQGQMYANEYGYDNNYYQNDNNRYSYDKKEKTSHTDIQKISCLNSNINVNGIDITQIPEDSNALAAANEGSDATGAQNGNGWGDKINFEKNLVNICLNVNVNEQVKVTPPEEPQPPTEPPTCGECLTDNLDEEQLEDLFPFPDPAGGGSDKVNNVAELCTVLASLTSVQEKQKAYTIIFIALDNTASITDDERDAIIDCLLGLGLIVQPPP